MNNQILKISLRFGLILGGVNIISVIIGAITYNPEKLSQPNSLIISIISYSIMIIILSMAHYEFNRKNEDFLSFKNAILIGILILGISFIISTIFSFMSYDLLMKEKMQIVYSNFNEKYGTEISNYFTTNTRIIGAIIGLLVQILLLFVLLIYEALWKIYKKAGKAGWASLVPIYSIIVLLDIVKKPSWWLLLLLIPIVNIIFAIWMTNLLSKRFGKNESFTLGLIFLPFVFYPLLGLSKTQFIPDNKIQAGQQVVQ